MVTDPGSDLEPSLRREVTRLADEFRGTFSRESIDRCARESLDRLEGARVGRHASQYVYRFTRERLAAVVGPERFVGEQPSLLFVCVRNAGRSQMAAAFAEHLTGGRIRIGSAGSTPAPRIDPAVVRAMAQLGFDLAGRSPGPLTDEAVSAADVVIRMGCGDAYPIYPLKTYEDWSIEDPAGQPIEKVRSVEGDRHRRAAARRLPAGARRDPPPDRARAHRRLVTLRRPPRSRRLAVYDEAMTRPSVLVVGAGPTGLLMACQLLRLDIPFRIIDAKAGPTTESRALAIQARSLEILAQMGIAAAAVAQGKQGKAISYVVNGTLTQRISLEGFGNGLTAFPYLLILEQSKTEQLLVDFLRQRDHRVEWNTELVSIARDQGGVSAHVRGAGKRGETVRVPWLVGADGAKSVVRHSLGIPFVGETYRRSLFVLDCRVDLPFRNDEMYTAFSADSFAAFFPMTDGRCRVAGVLPDELADDDEVTFQEVNRHFAERLKMRVVLSDPHWISRYHAHHRYAAAFRRGRCFLAGDAAHIHSPVGGQGMNTGLQDAYNLAWKLALVIRGAADPRLLDTYNQERLPVGKRLVRTTDRAFNVTVSRNPFTVFMRLHVAPHLLAFGMKLGPVQRLAFESISQIGITYRGSSLSRGASRGRFPRSAPRPGDRLPYALMAGGAASVNVQEKVSGTTLHLLIFSGVEDGERARALRSMVDRRYPGTVTADTIALTAGTASLYRRFGLEREGWYLIRPDMHIASRNDQLDVEGLVEALARVLRLGQTRAG